ncbi:MAG: fibrobacter succinogenes major paralogous domain-containing protein, partial [Bacteroidales bacterium]|nr:fibrobacter succinogenes major paralogous domain-containing protein [Bacteroidales bacterium]
MKKFLLCVIFALFLLPLAVMGQCGTDNLTAQDAEGTTFNSVKVGPHCWLKPNLSIKLDSSKIYKSEMYPDTDANLATFGRLYNWYTAMNVQPGQSPVVGEHGFVQGICPEGWHLPTEAEIRELMNHDAKTLHSTERWFVPGINTTGFTMLPGGYYNAMKKYGENLGGDCYMWSAQSLDPSNPTVIWSDCHCEYFLVTRGAAKNGMSVRCVYKIYQGEVTTDSVNQITSNSATLWGNVTFNGYAESYERGFVYGTDPANLDQWAVENPAASDETAPFSKEITGLTVATTYYYQAYIINDFDTAYGEVKSFATKDLAVTTNDATEVKSTSATLNGELTKLEGYANVNAGFKYGTSEDALTSISDVSLLSATGQYSANLVGLTEGTTYFFKAFAANGTDTAYGEVKSFATKDLAVT